MRRRKLFTIASITLISLVLIAYLIAQEAPRQRQQRPQFDPERMIQRTMERITQELKLSDEEAAVLKPKIENLLRTRMNHSQQIRQMIQSLRTAIQNDNSDQIKATLSELKAKRAEFKKAEEKLEKELTELLTLKQEAILTTLGVVNSDGGFGFGFFPRPRQGAQGGARRGG